jgi:hypothetical protein
MPPSCRRPHTPRVVGLASFALLTLACTPPSVVNPERATGGNGSAAAGSNGSSGGGGVPGTVIKLPDAAAGADTASPACAEEAYKAEAVPVDLMLLVDASGSMASAVSGANMSKWTVAQGALSSFVRDGRSAGLGVGLQFFPEFVRAMKKSCVSDVDCTAVPNDRCVGMGFCVDSMGR